MNSNQKLGLRMGLWRSCKLTISWNYILTLGKSHCWELSDLCLPNVLICLFFFCGRLQNLSGTMLECFALNPIYFWYPICWDWITSTELIFVTWVSSPGNWTQNPLYRIKNIDLGYSDFFDFGWKFAKKVLLFFFSIFQHYLGFTT